MNKTLYKPSTSILYVTMRIYYPYKRLLTAVLLMFFIWPCHAKIYYSKKEAMVLAFGEGATVEMLSLFPTDEDKQRIEQLSKVKLKSSFFTFYVGKKDEQVLGYAAIESHTVRSKPETLLIVLNANGELKAMHTLAFHEPPEYQPPQRWFEQLYGKIIRQLSFSEEIQAISGATISTRAAMKSARKVLAIYQVEIVNKQS